MNVSINQYLVQYIITLYKAPVCYTLTSESDPIPYRFVLLSLGFTLLLVYYCMIASVW